ncbi:helix-hairpin-helix domain-containing protein [Roseibium aggregatum]|uniref:helix-hairpin-helix domain-containing protein n=1 Tax=Roseibium aggregatum TaxID=187304 RepID=UPI0025AB5E5E|nr:helix-hairpin-helix domain-containing protein [Roseibium aggregatum]WJS05198.1 helix-hairpin-helix domain-containing protein [Roseibium aggregatum]
MYAKQRLYLTAKKDKVVAEGDKNAAFLYAAIGDEIPDSAAKQFGLVDGGLPEKGKAKDQDPGKGGSQPGGGDDLTKLKGIGKATAKALEDAGIATFAALADVDPQKPAILVPGVSEADWALWTTAAKELLAKNT